MTPPQQGLPVTALQKALTTVVKATPAIWNLLRGDKLFDMLVPPNTDANTLRPMPYAAWGNATSVPGSDASHRFGRAGNGTTLAFHVFSAQKYSKSEVAEVADQFVRAVSGKRVALEGHTVYTITVDLIGTFTVATGTQAVLSVSATTGVTA